MPDLERDCAMLAREEISSDGLTWAVCETPGLLGGLRFRV